MKRTRAWAFPIVGGEEEEEKRMCGRRFGEGEMCLGSKTKCGKGEALSMSAIDSAVNFRPLNNVTTIETAANARGR